MSRKNKGFAKKPVTEAVEAVVEVGAGVEAVVEAVVAEPVAAEPAAVAAVATKRLRLPLPAARAHNKQHTIVAADADKVEAANVALTAKGTNPKKTRVYGYDNLAEGGGRVPKDAVIAVVPGAELPKGVQDSQWTKLKGYAGQTVVDAYGNGVSSRTVRRAYRAGAIRFQKAAPKAAE